MPCPPRATSNKVFNNFLSWTTAFTSSPQIDRLFAVAQESGLMPELTQGLAKTQIAAIGPVMEQALAAHGLSSAIHPATSFHLKPMINAIVEAWKARA